MAISVLWPHDYLTIYLTHLLLEFLLLTDFLLKNCSSKDQIHKDVWLMVIYNGFSEHISWCIATF